MFLAAAETDDKMISRFKVFKSNSVCFNFRSSVIITGAHLFSLNFLKVDILKHYVM